jgi:peptide/nickel transport system permease protein
VGAYVLRRILHGLVVIVLVSLGTFFMMRVIPGDPLDIYIHEKEISGLSKEDKEALRSKLGLDKPLLIQYLSWVKGVFKGDLGDSWFQNKPVSALISERMPVTINIGILAFLMGAIVGPVLGTICAIKRGTLLDGIITVLANVGITMPTFWFGILLIYLFSLELQWLPVFGYTSPFDDFGMFIKQAIMPVACLALPMIAGLTRQTRSAVLEVVSQDYVRTAWSKGLTERIVVFKHVIKNAFIPVVTMIGMQFSMIFGGSVLIENVFNIPGMGRLLVNAVFAKDFQIVQSGVLIMAAIVVFVNLVVDISYGWFDPRVRLS